nr:helix-turn-helix transcriptional regulator [Paenibacillus larvae]
MKSTIYDVAKSAGVSIATVSKVINQTGNISEKTRERVLHTMKELQYQPSVVASALTGKNIHLWAADPGPRKPVLRGGCPQSGGSGPSFRL